jgi:phosphotransacetylase/acyl dehydratase
MTHYLENRTFAEIAIGDSARLTRTLDRQTIQMFARITGDMNPAHLDEAYAKTAFFHGIVGHGMWTGSLFSALLGTQLPGPGTIYLHQTLRFLHPVCLDETVTASVTVLSKDDAKHHVTFRTLCENARGETVIDGEAVVLAPAEKIRRELVNLPELALIAAPQRCRHLLQERRQGLPALKTAVVHPVDLPSLEGALAAAEAGIIEPLLVGPEHKIRQIAEEHQLDLQGHTLIPTEHSHAAAARAIQLVHEGRAEALMKGKLATEELMEAVVAREGGLRTGRRMSHVFLVDVPSYPKPLLLTDAALNIQPHLMDKRDIVQNAIDLYRTLLPGTPRVAILSAVETVNENIPSTLDATALCKMAERGQITGGIVDGPLAFDNAVSPEAVRLKGIHSAVAGQADILIVPDIESGNMLYKQLRYFSGAQGAGLVLGARVPIILTSRAAEASDRIDSAALALIYARAPHTI